MRNLDISNKTTYQKSRPIEYIVLHYTAGLSSKAGSAYNTMSYFKTSQVQASADYCVDDKEIVQGNLDIPNRFSWAVGGTKYTTMSTSVGGKYYGKCRNDNSISIEMCSNKKNPKSMLATDTDWFLTEETIANAVKLTKKLMKQYSIDEDHVIMHHHVTGKICPNPWCVNEEALKNWKAFKKKIVSDETEKKLVSAETKSSGSNTKTSSSYYKKYVGNSASIVDALQSIGVDSSFCNRKKIAAKNGIKSYTGTAEQNTKLLKLLKQGKLRKIK